MRFFLKNSDEVPITVAWEKSHRQFGTENGTTGETPITQSLWVCLFLTSRKPGYLSEIIGAINMRISDAEVKKALSGFTAVDHAAEVEALKQVLGVESEAEAAERDALLVRETTRKVMDAPDREDMIESLKERIAAGTYNPSAEDIVDTMVRRAIADRMR